MTKMKKYISVFFIASFFLTSCEDFLTVVPETQLSSATFFKSQKDFEQAVNSAYVPLRTIFNNRAWLLSEMHSDNTYYARNVLFGATDNQEDLADFSVPESNGTSANTHVLNQWRQDYLIISRTNQILSLIDEVDFDAAAKAKKYGVRPVNSLKILDENIPGVGSQRPIVRWAFEDETNVGDVKRFNIPNGYVIAQLVAKYKEGLMSVEEASATVTPIIRKEKNAEMIRNKVSAKTIDAVAKSQKITVQTATGITMKNPMISGVGREPLVVGAAFGLKQGQTSKLIDGVNGVYMVKVTKVEPAVKLTSYQAIANRVEQQKLNVVSSKLFTPLKEISDIEDNRPKNQIQ